MGFLNNEILGFDENLAVVLLSDLQQCVRLQFSPQSVCVRTAPGNVNIVAYGKINTWLSPPTDNTLYRPYTDSDAYISY